MELTTIMQEKHALMSTQSTRRHIWEFNQQQRQRHWEQQRQRHWERQRLWQQQRHWQRQRRYQKTII